MDNHVLQAARLCRTRIEENVLVADGQVVAADTVDATDLPRQAGKGLSRSARAELRPDDLERTSMHAEVLVHRATVACCAPA
jgi:hypothetical protein